MSQATFAGRPFRVNPLSASWDYSVKTSETNTVGGTVIQVFGVDLGPMTIRGTFGSQHVDINGRLVGGWQEQEAFLKAMRYVGTYQAHSPDPVRFLYPSKGWDFLVNLMSFSEVGSNAAMHASNENFSPTWELGLFVVEDNSPIRTVQDAALLQYINRLSAGLGWRISKYNGPINEAEVQSYVAQQSASSVQDLVSRLAD